MNHRRRVVALGMNTLAFALLLAGCADYNADEDTGTGGTTGAAGNTGTGGTDTGTGGADTGTGGTDTGTGGGETTCTDVTPCGGEVSGTWTVTSSCLTVGGDLDMTQFGLNCSSTPVSGSLQVTGTLTLGSDLQYQDNTHTAGSVQLDLPPECLFLSGTMTTCERMGIVLGSMGYAEISCTPIDPNAPADDPSGCNCPATIDQTGGIGLAPMFPSASGPYTTDGTTLSLSGGAEEFSYCVTGATLTLTPLAGSTTGALTGTVDLSQ